MGGACPWRTRPLQLSWLLPALHGSYLIPDSLCIPPLRTGLHYLGGKGDEAEPGKGVGMATLKRIASCSMTSETQTSLFPKSDRSRPLLLLRKFIFSVVPCLFQSQSIKKMWCIYTTEYYSPMKKKETAICSNMVGPRDDHTQ